MDSEGASRLLGLRVVPHPRTLSLSDQVGGFHTTPLLGEMEAISAQHRMRWDELIRAYAGSLLQAIVFGLLGIVALSLTLFDRSDRV
jgi:hypothetical protein